MDIRELWLGRRVETCLRAEGFETVEQLVLSAQGNQRFFSMIPNLGKESVARLLQFFVKLNSGEILQELAKLDAIATDTQALRKLIEKAEKYERISAIVYAQKE